MESEISDLEKHNAQRTQAEEERELQKEKIKHFKTYLTESYTVL